MNIIKIEKINSNNFISLTELILESIKSIAVSLIAVTTNTVIEEKIDETEEYLNIRETTLQVKINNNPKAGDKANKTPKYVATPLPPLNFNQIGKICPKKTIKHDN